MFVYMHTKVFTFSYLFDNIVFLSFSPLGDRAQLRDMLPKKFLSLGFQRLPFFIFPLKFLIKSALHVVKTFYIPKPASNNFILFLKYRE